MWYIVMGALVLFAGICGGFMGLSMDKYLDHEENHHS